VFRDETEAHRITYVHHKIMAVTDDVEALYRAEEWLVRQHWEDERRLNMIPGGRAGWRGRRQPDSATTAVRSKADAVCARGDRLSVDQVRSIRCLRGDVSASEIATRVSARNVRQVRGVLANRTYQCVSDEGPEAS